MEHEHLEKLKDLAISESGFVFDPHTGATFTTNGAGREILMGLRDGLDRKAVVARVRKAFELRDDDDPERDLDEFVHLLRDGGIVPPAFQL